MDVSDIFIFFCSGRGKAEFEAPGGGRGFVFLFENPRGGGLSRSGARRVSPANWGIYGGGGGALNFFFRGRHVHQARKMLTILPVSRANTLSSHGVENRGSLISAHQALWERPSQLRASPKQFKKKGRRPKGLVAPYRAILRYYHCATS